MTDSSTAATPSIADAAGEWKLDPTRSSVEIRTKAMWGLLKVKGTFAATEGAGTVGGDGSVSGRLVIDAKSVNTKIGKRDEHLRSNDFFDAENYPVFTYDATSASPAEDGRVRVAGTLTVRDQTKPLELVATIDRSSADEAVVKTEAVVDRRDWGVNLVKMGSGVHIAVSVSALFTRA